MKWNWSVCLTSEGYKPANLHGCFVAANVAWWTQDVVSVHILKCGGRPLLHGWICPPRHVRLHNCGPLGRLVPLHCCMPGLTHLAASHHPDMDQWHLGCPLGKLLPAMPRLRTLLLPNSSGYGLLDLSLLNKAAGSLRHVEINYLWQDVGASGRWVDQRLVSQQKADDLPFTGVMILQVHPYTLSVLPHHIVNTLAPPVTVRCLWRRTTCCGYDFTWAGSKLDTCCRASAAKIKVAPGAKPNAQALSGLTLLVSRGVHRLEVVWLAQQVQTTAHVQAPGHAVGRHITHLTFITGTYISNEVWSGLWAAFPHLEY